MSVATIIPEGYERTQKPMENSLFFQNVAGWAKEGVTGIVIEGIYEGRTEKDGFGKINFQFKAIADGTAISTKGKAPKQEVLFNDFKAGDTVIVNKAGNLEYVMKDCIPGTKVVLVYQGTSEITSDKSQYKGTMAHQFELLVAKKLI